MNDRYLPTPILLGFAVAALAVIAIGLLGYRSLLVQTVTARQVSHTLEVRDQSELLLASMTDAETGQRGFLLTGDEAYLAPYEQGRAEAEPHLARLRALVADNPAQLERATVIEAYVSEKLAELARTVELRRSGH